MDRRNNAKKRFSDEVTSCLEVLHASDLVLQNKVANNQFICIQRSKYALISKSFNSLFRTLSPILFGLSYSWSLTNIKYRNIKIHPSTTSSYNYTHYNEHPLGFPFNQYFTFFLMSIMCFVLMVCVWFLKTSTPKNFRH